MMLKKGVFLLGLVAFIFCFSCKNGKNEKNAAQAEKQKTDALMTSKDRNSKREKSRDIYRGEFIYTDTAAVLKGADFIYGVKIDSASKKLGQRIKPMLEHPYDMVNVVVKGDLKDNEQEGWEKVLTIKKVLAVRKPKNDESIKINSNNNNNQ